jgi:hypothetical protein
VSLVGSKRIVTDVSPIDDRIRGRLYIGFGFRVWSLKGLGLRVWARGLGFSPARMHRGHTLHPQTLNPRKLTPQTPENLHPKPQKPTPQTLNMYLSPHPILKHIECLRLHTKGLGFRV